jgi:uncharacterized integral membrane protein (TIGR00698 family)
MITFILFSVLAFIAFFKIPPHWSMLLGVLIALIFPPSNLFKNHSKSWSTRLLQLSVILLGAGLNFQSIIYEGYEGIFTTFLSISSILLLGTILAKIFQTPTPLSILITFGTSICGGSAISAMAPIINAPPLAIATSLGIVFILNGLSVFIFPPIGQFLDLNQQQFGTWAALAIHDTSSVIASTQIFGEEALKIGTTLKLTRALWILPATFIFSLLKKTDNKVGIPWFIFLFLLMSLIFSFFRELQYLTSYFLIISKIGLSLTLFLIGLNLNKSQIKDISMKPVMLGVTLWVLTALGSVLYVINYI